MSARRRYVLIEELERRLEDFKQILKLQNLVFFLLSMIVGIGLGLMIALLLN